MNDEWNQSQADNGDNWNEVETPYVSKYTPVEENDLCSRVATRAFLVVFLGLLVTTLASYITLFNQTMFQLVFSGNTFTFLLIAELVVVLVNSWAIRKANLLLAGALYAVYTIINGITMSVVFLAYGMGTVMEAFLIAGIVFGVMAAYGYFAKKDLSTIGSICSMALIGVILVSLANALLIHSSGLDLIMDYVVVLLFVGITAYDMHRMKKMVVAGGEKEISRVALFTGMQLYLDFINIFLRLLRIMGRRR